MDSTFVLYFSTLHATNKIHWVSRKQHRRQKRQNREKNVESKNLHTEKRDLDFRVEKEEILKEIEKGNDRSRAGKVDEAILPLVNAINQHPDLYTTSSCAGRYILTRQSQPGYGAMEWLFCSHDLSPSFSQLMEAVHTAQQTSLSNSQSSSSVNHEVSKGEVEIRPSDDSEHAEEANEVWLKVEGPIVALRARHSQAAESFLAKARQAGCKRTFVASSEGPTKGPMLLLMVPVIVAAPIVVGGDLLVDERFLQQILQSGQRKLVAARNRCERLAKELVQDL